MAKAKTEKETKKVTKKTTKKDKDVEKSFDMEKAISNILKELQDISKRIEKIENRIDIINDVIWYEEDEESILDLTVDIYNKIEEVTEKMEEIFMDEDEE